MKRRSGAVNPNILRIVYLSICVAIVVVVIMCSSLPLNSNKEIIAVGIRTTTEKVYPNLGISFVWHVANKGNNVMSFSENTIAQITVNAMEYPTETEAISLSPGEVYDLLIRIPASCLRISEDNTVKITASSNGGTVASCVHTFQH